MNDRLAPSAGVILAAVVAIGGSSFSAVGALMGLMGLLLLPHVTDGPLIPLAVRASTIGLTLIFFGVAVFGILVGVGLFRLKNWARTAAIVLAAISAPVNALMLAFVLLVHLPTPPNALVNIAAITSSFYGLALAISVWWLIFFNRKDVVSQFHGASGRVAGPDFAGNSPAQGAPPRPSVPVPITVVACLYLSSAFSLLVMPLMQFPAVLFGFVITGLAGYIVDVIWCVLYGVAGVGMLKRLPWSLPLAIVLETLAFLTCVVTVLSPNYETVMRQVMAANPISTGADTMHTLVAARGMASVTSLLLLAILVVLVYYRSRFLEACAAPPRS